MNKQINVSTIKTQKDAVMWHLQKYGSITSWEAIKEYGATRLSGIIFNLRKEGYAIISEDKTFVNRFGKSTTIAKYKYLNPVGNATS